MSADFQNSLNWVGTRLKCVEVFVFWIPDTLRIFFQEIGEQHNHLDSHMMKKALVFLFYFFSKSSYFALT